jgi:hypothetical protein
MTEPTGDRPACRPDPLLQEIWRIKDELSARRGHDIHRLFDEARERQKHSGHKIVSFEESPPSQKK